MYMIQHQNPMELHFQPPPKPHHQIQVSKPNKFKDRKKSSNANKFVGVRQRPSGRWVAEIKDTTQKIRMWLGTFETAEEAARAYDEAACLLRGANTRTNFITHVSPDSPLASRIRNLLNHKKQSKVTPKPVPVDVAVADMSNGIQSYSSLASPTSTVGSFSFSNASMDVSEMMVGNNIYQNSAALCNDLNSQFLVANDQVYRPFCNVSGGEELCMESAEPSVMTMSHPWACNDPVMDSFELQSNVMYQDAFEVERLKMERQMMLSSMSGMQVEYFDQMLMHDPLLPDGLWDLAPLCHLACRT